MHGSGVQGVGCRVKDAGCRVQGPGRGAWAASVRPIRYREVQKQGSAGGSPPMRVLKGGTRHARSRPRGLRGGTLSGRTAGCTCPSRTISIWCWCFEAQNTSTRFILICLEKLFSAQRHSASHPACQDRAQRCIQVEEPDAPARSDCER